MNIINLGLVVSHLSAIGMLGSTANLFPYPDHSGVYRPLIWYSEESPQEMYEIYGGTDAIYEVANPAVFNEIYMAENFFNLVWDSSTDAQTEYQKRWNGTWTIDNAWITDPTTNPTNTVTVSTTFDLVKGTGTNAFVNTYSKFIRSATTAVNGSSSSINGSTSTALIGSGFHWPYDHFGVTSMMRFYNNYLFPGQGFNDVNQSFIGSTWFGLQTKVDSPLRGTPQSSGLQLINYASINGNTSSSYGEISQRYEPFSSTLHSYGSGINNGLATINWYSTTTSNQAATSYYSDLKAGVDTLIYFNADADAILSTDNMKVLYTIAYARIGDGTSIPNPALEYPSYFTTSTPSVRIAMDNPTFTAGVNKLNATSTAGQAWDWNQVYFANTYAPSTSNPYRQISFTGNRGFVRTTSGSRNSGSDGNLIQYMNILVDYSVIDSETNFVVVTLPYPMRVAGISRADWSAYEDLIFAAETEGYTEEEYLAAIEEAYDAGALEGYSLFEDLTRGLVGGTLAFVLSIGSISFLGISLNTLIFLVVTFMIISVLWTVVRGAIGGGKK